MAKTSSVERNNKRERMAKQFAAKRAKLKAVASNREASAEERFEAMLKLAELPRNSSVNRVRTRCELTGRPRGNYRKFKLCAHAASRARPRRGRSPAWSSRAGRETPNMMTDPLGDMLTRIRNGQMARKTVGEGAGLAAAQQRARSAQARGLYPRLLASPKCAPASSELTIELKYHEGEPVIRAIDRVSKPGRRVYSKIKDLPRVSNGLGHFDPVDAARRHVGCRGPRRQCRRRSPLPGVLGRRRDVARRQISGGRAARASPSAWRARSCP